jgi:mutator protein MutT
MNKDLYGTFFPVNSIPLRGVIDNLCFKYGKEATLPWYIKYNDEDGKKPYEISYSYAKKVKNFFKENTDEKNRDFIINGGHEMKNFVNKVLDDSRSSIKRSKTIKMNTGMQNQFIKPHEKDNLRPTKIDNLKLKTKEKIELTEWVVKNKVITDDSIVDNNRNQAVVCVIINPEKKILVVKRSNNTSWEPKKFALVGGKVDDGESCSEAIVREIFEETNILLKSLYECFNTIDGDYDVTFYIGFTDNSDVKLSLEHTEFQWVSPSELPEYDSVPNMIENIQRTLTIYTVNEITK